MQRGAFVPRGDHLQSVSRPENERSYIGSMVGRPAGRGRSTGAKELWFNGSVRPLVRVSQPDAFLCLVMRQGLGERETETMGIYGRGLISYLNHTHCPGKIGRPYQCSIGRGRAKQRLTD